MLFMNTYEIDEAVQQWRQHPVLGPAARTLRNLSDWADGNSDGWAYWPKPCRAATKLQEMLQREDRWTPPAATAEELKAALKPIKAFRTRQGADFEIEEAS
jgi:hypothetical protein